MLENCAPPFFTILQIRGTPLKLGRSHTCSLSFLAEFSNQVRSDNRDNKKCNNHRNIAGIIASYLTVYVVWGSTYLGIRVAVEHVPPILMAGIRFSVAGSLMLAFCAATGRSVSVGRERLLKLALIGFLLLAVSNAVLAWAELFVPTGLAALIVAVVPIWFLLVELFVLPGASRLSASGKAGIGLGLAGTIVLFHAAWLAGLFFFAPGHEISWVWLGVFLVLQAARAFERERPWHPEWPEV